MLTGRATREHSIASGRYTGHEPVPAARAGLAGIHSDSLERTMQAAGKCPTELPGLLGWFNRMLDAEAPAKLHKSGVEPDSVLGSPDRTEAFRRYIELDPLESDNAGYYFRPLAAAIATLGTTKPFAAMWLREVGRAGDWRVVARRRNWTDEETEVYLTTILQLLWHQFKPDIRRR